MLISMKTIPLTQGRAIVDDDDFEELNQWKWFLSDGGYACRSQHIHLGTNKYMSKKVRMHRLINKTPNVMITDHINRNKLDNRRCNLRTCDKSLNGINRDKSSNNKSGYKGVYWDSWSSKWRAEIKINYKKICLGRFKKLEKAVFARRQAEALYYKRLCQSI